MRTAKKKDEQSASPVPKKAGQAGANGVSKDMSFIEAMEAIISGNHVARREWPDKYEHCLLRDGFLMIYHKNDYHRWLISEGDIMSRDWVLHKKPE